MRKSKKYCLLVLAISTLFSCEKQDNDKTWDFDPISISFYIQDEDGNDLLNPATEGNIAENEIKVIYNKNEYPRDRDMSETGPYMGMPRGLKTEKDDNGYKLTFGEFDGAKGHDKSFTLDLGDYQWDDISFTYRIEWENNTPKTLTEVSLNGKKTENNVTIIMNEYRGMIWDFAPLNISFYVKDSEGNDLLNPATEGNITENNIKIIYDGKEFLRDVDMSETRALPATFRGLMTQEHKNENFLTFGEFNRDMNHDKSFVIDWGDGRKDNISFIHLFEWENYKPKMSTEVLLNEKKVEMAVERIFTVVK